MNNNDQMAFLYDSTKCMGCRGCQVACKQWHELPAEKTRFFAGGADSGYQNPIHLSEHTYTMITFHEVVEDGKLMDWAFWKTQCQHCLEPACASVCLVGAMHKTENGPVVWDSHKCIGCRYCMLACPFNIPKFEWKKVISDIRKCDFCADRIAEGLLPACAKTCATGAILFGKRGELIEIAKERLSKDPEKYYQHIYGLEEAGGTCVLNISNVPLKHLGYPDNVPMEPLEKNTQIDMAAISPAVIGLGAILGVTAFVINRRIELAKTKEKGGQNE